MKVLRSSSKNLEGGGASVITSSIVFVLVCLGLTLGVRPLVCFVFVRDAAVCSSGGFQ